MRPLGFAAFGLLAAGLALAGVVSPDDPIPSPGQAGAPSRPLSAAEQARFKRGRQLFDKDFGKSLGVGPVMNGDSCRACHIDPVMAGSGGIDVQVQRPTMDDYSPPVETGEVAQTKAAPGEMREEIPTDARLVEERNSPTLLGAGLIDTLSEATILAGQDPTDANGDGVFGVAHMLPGGRVGRFGWKANVPDLRGFVRDALSTELGITVVPDAGSSFGELLDADAVQDPEIDAGDIDDLLFFVQMLAFPPKRAATTQTQQGEALFTQVGCAKCHVPALDGVELYSNLLLHDVHPGSFDGVVQGQAGVGSYRTAPLRGLRDTAPYFHDGRSPTVDAAIRRHDGEALAVRQAFEALSDAERAALIAFLDSL